MTNDIRIETMRELREVLKKARSEEAGLPLSTIAVVVAESMGDTKEVEVIIRQLQEYIR